MKLPCDRKHIPQLATALLLLLLLGAASLAYDNFMSLRVVVNLFADNAFIGIVAVGMTFVIISGGIDLSVGAVVAYVSIFLAALIGDKGMNPFVAMGLALALGTAFGAAMGGLIHGFSLPPFLVTIGGMFFARGMAFNVDMQARSLSHPTYDALLDLGIPLTAKVSIPLSALIMIAAFAIAGFILNFTRFGRQLYAIGGSDSSAKLMGLPIGASKIGVYAFSGFCSALGGIVATLYMGSGNPAMGVGLELEAIAAVVIGGTLLTGGVGRISGTLMGVLILGTIYVAIIFDGRLSASWNRIAIGILLLGFILLQRFLSRARVEQH